MSFCRAQIESAGLGLRFQHYKEIISTQPDIAWFEVNTEDHMCQGGRVHDFLYQLRQNYPIALHGVSLSIGSTDDLNWDYLRRLKDLVDIYKPEWVSDHFCWTSYDGNYLPDLFPLPHTREVVSYVSDRINVVQDFLKQNIVLENLSSYIQYTVSEMTEWEFISMITKKTGCKILLDVNNVYVCAHNHSFSPKTYIENLRTQDIQQIHLAGHESYGQYLIDTHSKPVSENVCKLYEMTLDIHGRLPTSLEWDSDLPSFDHLLKETKKIETLLEAHCAIA